MLFERELKSLMRQHHYRSTDVSRLIRTPHSQLNEEAQWVRLIAVQAGLEFMQRAAQEEAQ